MVKGWVAVAVVMLGGLGAGAQVAGGVFGGISGAPPQLPQAQAQQGPTGVVIGTVVAQDTQRPARFAQVQLLGVQQMQASVQGTGGNGGGFGAGFGGGGASVRTDVDGTFEAEGVAPGDYYVTATATGYVAERTLMQAQVAAGADPMAVLASLPQVHVTANETSSVTVPMQRGGALAGHVEWEDGSAAAGVTVSAVAATTGSGLPAGLRGVQSFGTSYETTDDRGNFRLSGLPSGDYLVLTTITPSTQGGAFGRAGGPGLASLIRVYAPGVFRKADAKAVNVRAGDERTDVRMVIDLRGMHTVSGAAVSSNPGSAVASGRVMLVDASDATLTIQGAITATGTFQLRYVPPGNYTLQVTGASSQAAGRRGQTALSTAVVMYQAWSQAIVVGDADVSGVAVSLTPVKASGQ